MIQPRRVMSLNILLQNQPVPLFIDCLVYVALQILAILQSLALDKERLTVPRLFLNSLAQAENKVSKKAHVHIGYVIDNRLGNTNKLGALYGLLQGIGVFVPHPQPGTLGWKVGIAVDSTVNLVR